MLTYNQLVEYFAILYMIATQKNRNINEILYDFNHEPMGQRISKDQVSYRRKELKWIKFFHHLETLLIIFLLFNYFAMCFLYELDSTDFPLYYLPIAIQYEVNFILTIFCFVFLSKLMYSMFKLHRQEFQRVKYNLITEMVFFCALLA